MIAVPSSSAREGRLIACQILRFFDVPARVVGKSPCPGREEMMMSLLLGVFEAGHDGYREGTKRE